MIAQLRGSTPEAGSPGYMLLIAQQLVDAYVATTTTLAALPEDVLRVIASQLSTRDQLHFARVMRLRDVATVASHQLKIRSFCRYCSESLRTLCIYRMHSRCRIYADWSPFAGDGDDKLVSEIFVTREPRFATDAAAAVARDMYRRDCSLVRLSAHMCDVHHGDVVEMEMLPRFACLI